MQTFIQNGFIIFTLYLFKFLHIEHVISLVDIKRENAIKYETIFNLFEWCERAENILQRNKFKYFKIMQHSWSQVPWIHIKFILFGILENFGISFKISLNYHRWKKVLIYLFNQNFKKYHKCQTIFIKAPNYFPPHMKLKYPGNCGMQSCTLFMHTQISNCEHF